MKHLLSSCILCFIVLSCFAQNSPDSIAKEPNNGKTQFGVLVKPPPGGAGGEGVNFKLNIAKNLRVDCIRDVVNLENPKDKVIFNSGFKIVLNVNNSALANKAQAPFPTDTAAYKTRLQYQLSLMMHKPILLVIENEENNMQFHSGSAQDYLNELQAAATVAHANKIPVTNGGITFPAMLYLVYLDYLEHGKTKEANDLQQRASVSFTANWLTNRKDFLKQLIAGYAKSDIDYVNFHWYGKNGDTKSLVEVVNYLERATGKPVITNEIGQQDASPETVKAILQTCRQLHLRYAIWYSGDGERNTTEQAVGLQNNDGSLRDGGEAFKNEIQ